MRDTLKPLLMIGPLLLFLALAYLVPFLGVVKWSFTLPQLGLTNYGNAVTDPLVISVFIRTFRICLFVTIFAVIAAYAIAFIWVRGTPAQRQAAAGGLGNV